MDTPIVGETPEHDDELTAYEHAQAHDMVEDGPPKKIYVPKPTSPMASLLAKLDAWLLQQPEYIVLLASAPRSTRRKAAKLLASHIMTYPKRGQFPV